MAWHGIEGHDRIVEQFRRAVERGRLAASFLFVGPPGVGKRSFALKLAQALLCERHEAAALDPCGQCQACQQVEAGTHPDVHLVAKPADRSEIPVATLIGDKEHRGREGLCHDLAMKPYSGRRRVAVIDDADTINPEGANALLKTLEEPPPHSLLILVGTSPAKQLPTIRSRCQLVRFEPLPPEVVARLLLEQGIAEDAPTADRLARYADGSLQHAAELADPDLWSFRERLLDRLAGHVLDSPTLSDEVSRFVDAAGKAAPLRRARFRQVVAFAAEFYRHLLRLGVGDERLDDPTLRTQLDAAVAAQGFNADRVGRQLERCLDAAEQIDRNANQSTLIETWLDDLAAAGRSQAITQ
jgi:DNA polymerase-3 subunit delta'